MPIFEYRCGDCNSKYEVLVKSASSAAEVSCPKCHSVNSTKLFSTFAAQPNGSSDMGGCSDGSCGYAPSGGCASGMCGLN